MREPHESKLTYLLDPDQQCLDPISSLNPLDLYFLHSN